MNKLFNETKNLPISEGEFESLTSILSDSDVYPHITLQTKQVENATQNKSKHFIC